MVYAQEHFQYEACRVARFLCDSGVSCSQMFQNLRLRAIYKKCIGYVTYICTSNSIKTTISLHMTIAVNNDTCRQRTRGIVFRTVARPEHFPDGTSVGAWKTKTSVLKMLMMSRRETRVLIHYR